MKWREKQLPHYFGRLVHALDLVKYSQNEGTLMKCQVYTVRTLETLKTLRATPHHSLRWEADCR